MSKYLLVFTGGSIEGTPEMFQEMLAAWGRWYEMMGPSIVDAGSAVMPHVNAVKVTENGVENGVTDTKITGYAIVQTDTKEQAVQFAQACPILKDDGTVEVHEFMAVG